jgi:Tfp pilus assembly protein PilX
MTHAGGAALRAAHRLPPHLRQRGTSLFFALSALVGLSLAGVAMMRTSDTSTMVVGNIGFHEAAVQSTDLALEAAVASLATFAKTAASFNNVTASHYYASLDATAADATQPPAGRLSATVGNQISDSATGNTLRYVVERMCNATGLPNPTNCLMEDSASPVFRITTLVVGPRNTSEVVQHYVTAGGFTANCAIMTNETLNTNGVVQVTGTGNCVYSNTNVNWTNSPSSMVGQVNAVGTISGNVAAAGGTENAPAPQIAIPEINPANYKAHADYLFKADGKIYNKAGTLVTDTAVSGAWWGWSLDSSSPVRWRKASTTPSPEGLYFFEGNVTSSANIGSVSNPFRVSIFATGSIDLSGGSSYYDDYKGTDPTVPQGVKDVFLMAGGDINFRGSFPPTAAPGSLLANEEIDVRGSSGFNGNIIARNTNSTDPVGIDNVANVNNLSGTTSIAYNPTSISPLWSNVPIRRQWRTVER